MEVTWNITSECNLNCKHCYTEQRNTGSMNEKTETRLLKELAEIGVDKIALSGGEPFLKKNLKQLVRNMRAHDMRCSFVTNGTVMDYDVIERCEPEAIQVSIDGTREFHDGFRGAPSYDRAIETLKKLKDFHFLTVGVNTTVMKDNRRQIDQLLEEIHPFIDAYRSNLLVPVGKGRFIVDRRLEPSEVIDLVRDLFRLETIYPDISFTIPKEYVAQKALLDGEIEPRSFRKYADGCSSCRVYQSISISSNGNVLPCEFLQDNILGNLRERTLKEILSDRKGNDDLEKCACEYVAECDPCPARVLKGTDVYCIKVLPSYNLVNVCR
jgi:radical SAM protein with 4Fe4S-binding SPASM domain